MYTFPMNPLILKGLIILTIIGFLWISEIIPLSITSLLVPVLAVALRVSSVKDALSPFAHPIIFLFMGGFALAGALHKYEIDSWIAQKMLSLAGGRFRLSVLFLMYATALLSMWISNTATTAMMLPIALGISPTPYVLLSVAYAASIGGVGTLVGSPPNGITAGILNISFGKWTEIGFPLSMVSILVAYFILTIYFKPPSTVLKTGERKIRLVKKAYLTLGIFLLTAIFWIGGFVHEGIVAIGAIILLAIAGIMDTNEFKAWVNWPVLLLFGGGISLSHVLSTTGASKYLAHSLVKLLGNSPLVAYVFVMVLFSLAFTELTSNTATAAITIPILVSVASQLGVSPLAIALPAGFAVSFAFMLPVATPPNALVYATGVIKQKTMIKVGGILEITFALIITLAFTLIIPY